MSSTPHFDPEQPLLAGPAHERCRAVVIVPARNEEASLQATLDGLAAQRSPGGGALDPNSFEILLLLNNCTDSSAQVARAWRAQHPHTALHILERTLPPCEAHVGTARRLLMDTAWSRLRGRGRSCGILSTDSDTVVAPDWIAQTLSALALGADAVGGFIELKEGELERLPEGARTAYLRDCEYQRLFAELEDLLDPQPGDPWPRHLHHFGASLACSPAAYQRAGGLPPINPLEDMAFVDALYRADARLRHDPAVRVFTSARFDGRASVGLSWQLRTWQQASEAGTPHEVCSCSWLQHRFQCLRTLRQMHRGGREADHRSLKAPWRDRAREALGEELTTGEFLARIDCDAWIAETYTGSAGEEEITRVNRDLGLAIARQRGRLLREAAKVANSAKVAKSAKAAKSAENKIPARRSGRGVIPVAASPYGTGPVDAQ